MKNKIFGLTTAIALAMIAAGGGSLWAQGMGVTGWSSPQSTATQGRIRSAADDFIRPDSYTSARIGNWFTMASFQSTNTAYLGYAKKLGKAYIGAYYGGSFWAGLEPFNYTERYEAAWPSGPTTVPVYTDLTIDDATTTNVPTGNSRANNRVALLIGVADMGFRLSYYTTHQSFSKSDIAQDTGTPPTATYYKSYKTEYGVIRPQLAWSMTKNLTENGIKPYVTVDLNFQRDYEKSEEAVVGNSPGEEIDHSANYFQPILQLGLGGYTFYTKEAFRLSVDFEYRLTANMYSNEYSYYDSASGKNKIEKIKGLNNGLNSGAPAVPPSTTVNPPVRSGDLTENSYLSNLIMPYLAAQWGEGPVALRARLQLPVTITSTKETEMDLDVNYKLVKVGADTSSAFIGFNPSLQLALQWRPITKLAINAGGLINLGTIGRTTTEGSVYDADGNVIDNSSTKGVTKRYDATANQLTLGVTFNPTEYLFFEAACGTNAALTGNRFNVFSTGNDGPFNFGSILVGLKF